MPLTSGLYKSQDQQEQDQLEGPGWTLDDQKPSLFGNFAGAIPRGVGQGGADAIAALAHGSAAVGAGAREAALAEAGLPATDETPWLESPADETERRAREFSKSLIPDPRTTGVASNIVQGFSKAATEFTAGSLAGGPAGGAALLGATDGYAHYQDLLDQGVDEDTAARSGLLTGLTSGGSAILPMGMPAKWLAGLGTAGTLLAQAGSGAAINTGFGIANRYASAKILSDAGYDTAAEQQKPLDAESLLTDAISGAFFGAHAGWHGLKDLRADSIDPSIRDAAKVVQDRQEVVDRAPGVPVDPRSAAVHRELLGNAVADLMTGHDVDSSAIDVDGAAFAHGEVDDAAATKIIQDEFMKSGVLDDLAAHDKWLSNGFDDEIASNPAARTKVEAEPDAAETPETVKAGEPPEDHEPEGVAASPEAASALAANPDLKIVNENGEPLSAAAEQQRAAGEEDQANKEADVMHEAAVNCEARYA